MSHHNERATLEKARLAFNSGDLTTYINILYTEDVHFHFLPPELPQGHAGAKLYYGVFYQAFPDARFYVDDMIEDGDKMALRFRFAGTHLGDFNGIPPTGKSFEINGMTIMRWKNGMVVERWNEADFLGLLQQLGVIPVNETV